MENEYITPGTAGLAQRISSDYELSNKTEEELYVLKPNRLMTCTHNQY